MHVMAQKNILYINNNKDKKHQMKEIHGRQKPTHTNPYMETKRITESKNTRKRKMGTPEKPN